MALGSRLRWAGVSAAWVLDRLGLAAWEGLPFREPVGLAGAAVAGAAIVALAVCFFAA